MPGKPRARHLSEQRELASRGGKFCLSCQRNRHAWHEIGSVWGADSYENSVLSFYTIPSTDRIRFNAVTKNTSEVSVWTQLDYETEPVVSFVMCASDDGARNNYVDVMKDCGNLTLIVNDVNEAPIFSATTGELRTVVEAAQLNQEDLHFQDSGGLFLGDNIHDLYRSDSFRFGFGDVDFATAMSIRTDKAGGNVLFLLGPTDDRYLDISVDDDGKLTVSTDMFSLSSKTVVTDDEWHYVAVIYTVSNSQLRLFIDGELEGTLVASLGSPTIASQAVLSRSIDPFSGWISRFHYFSGAISLDQVIELTAYSGKEGAAPFITVTLTPLMFVFFFASVPYFYKLADAVNASISHKTGEHYCSSKGLRLCDPLDFTTLCVDLAYGPSAFPSASQGTITVPACKNSATRAEQNAQDATLACCSISKFIKSYLAVIGA